MSSSMTVISDPHDWSGVGDGMRASIRRPASRIRCSPEHDTVDRSSAWRCTRRLSQRSYRRAAPNLSAAPKHRASGLSRLISRCPRSTSRQPSRRTPRGTADPRAVDRLRDRRVQKLSSIAKRSFSRDMEDLRCSQEAERLYRYRFRGQTMAGSGHHCVFPSITSIGCASGSKSCNNHAFTCTRNFPATGRFACWSHKGERDHVPQPQIAQWWCSDMDNQ